MGVLNHMLRALARCAGRWRTASEGNVAILFSVLLPIVIAGAGFGVETTYWYLTRLQMQTAADAAAHAAAMDMRTGSSDAAVLATATSTVSSNGFNTAQGTIEVNNPPLSGGGGNQAVEVILRLDAPRFFTAIFSSGAVHVEARAVATFSNAGNACVLALSSNASNAVLFSGSSQMTLNGCSVMANSVSPSAVTVQGSATLDTDCVISGGGVSLTENATLDCGAPVIDASPVADPFKDLPVPTDATACKSDNAATLSPGRYCSGMNLKDVVNLEPGVYIVSGGDFKVNANAHVIGEGVTIYLASGANVSLNGNAEVDLTAPTSGTYSGILFFGDRAGSGTNTFNGTADSTMTGAIYFKSQKVAYIGNFAGVNGCTQVVANLVEFSGNTTVSADCTGKGMQTIPARMIVKLTE